ncbi:MAG TPA: 6-bladed beta-propeller [Gemmatimonadaceae bacterium]|nr:6-bladed beta-propeller [Gemmatimonadaceae bacterium]
MPTPSLRSPARALCAAALACTLAACQGSDDVATAARWQTVTDTLGDTIVVRTVGARDSAAMLTLVPEVRIGQLDGPDEYTFANAFSVSPAPHGGIYVYDGTLEALRQYDSAGTFVRRIGRKGGGPGEFEDPNGVVALPDGRVVVWDARHQRMNLYDTSGTFATSWRLPTNFFSSRALSVDTAGAIYALHMLDQFDAEHPTAPRRTGLVRLTADGTIRDTILAPALPEPAMLSAVMRSRGGVGVTRRPLPYAPQPGWEISPLGYVVSTPGDPYAILLHRAGHPLRIERDVPPVPVEPDEKENLTERITAQFRRSAPSWRWDGPGIPDTKPPIRSITLDAEGRVWVSRSLPSVPLEPDPEAEPPAPNAPPPPRWREPLAYDVFAPDGRFLGHLPVPRRTSLLYMHGDTVWASQRDSLDVPTVVRFRVEPSLATRAAGH